MFSQQEWRGMERDCYCCRPGPSSVSRPGPPAPFPMEPHSSGHHPHTHPLPALFQDTTVMDVEFALAELDSLNMATTTSTSNFSRPQPSTSHSSGAPPSREPQPQRGERKSRARSLSESMAISSSKPSKSLSETSLYRPAVETEGRGPGGGHYARLGGKVAGSGSSSLPRTLGAYHMVQRNSAFVSDISAVRPPPSSSSPWSLPDSGLGSFSEPGSSKSSSPSSLGSYRESDASDERQKRQQRQRKVSLFRKDRYRRLSQPYSIPFRMCQSMSEESTGASLNDFLTDASPRTCLSLSSSLSLSAGTSPLKPPQGQLTRWRSIDNLELARLRLTGENSEAKQTESGAPLAQDIDSQMATEMKNLHVV